MKSTFTGWVKFQPVHPFVRDALIAFGRRTRGNEFREFPDGVMMWRRPPSERGGVGEGRELPDFHRILARAVFIFDATLLTVTETGWSYREAVKGLVKVLDHDTTDESEFLKKLPADVVLIVPAGTNVEVVTR